MRNPPSWSTSDDELRELHLDHVVDRNAEVVRDRLDEELRAACLAAAREVRVERGVDLLHAAAGDLDHEVARDRHRRARVASPGRCRTSTHRVRTRTADGARIAELLRIGRVLHERPRVAADEQEHLRLVAGPAASDPTDDHVRRLRRS